MDPAPHAAVPGLHPGRRNLYRHRGGEQRRADAAGAESRDGEGDDAVHGVFARSHRRGDPGRISAVPGPPGAGKDSERGAVVCRGRAALSTGKPSRKRAGRRCPALGGRPALRRRPDRISRRAPRAGLHGARPLGPLAIRQPLRAACQLERGHVHGDRGGYGARRHRRSRARPRRALQHQRLSDVLARSIGNDSRRLALETRGKAVAPAPHGERHRVRRHRASSGWNGLIQVRRGWMGHAARHDDPRALLRCDPPTLHPDRAEPAPAGRHADHGPAAPG